MKTMRGRARWWLGHAFVAGACGGGGGGDGSGTTSDPGSSGPTSGDPTGPASTGDDGLDSSDGSTGGSDSGPTTTDGSGSSSDGGSGSSDASSSADGSESSTTAAVQAELLFIGIDPLNSILEIDLGTPATQDFVVTGYYSDGSSADLTASVETWDHTNPAVGSLVGPSLQVPGFATPFFASTIITATLGAEQAQAQVTVAAYDLANDFFFVLPFQDPGGETSKPLTFTTDIKTLDVFFDVDTTVSMGGPIGNLQDALTDTVIPNIQAQVPDTWFGAGTFQDFPVPDYGSLDCSFAGPEGPDQPFELLAEITADGPTVQAAVDAMTTPGGVPDGCGFDVPESLIESMYQIATGEGLDAPPPTDVAANSSGVGGVGFREGTMPVIVTITDAVSQDNDPAWFCEPQSYADDPGIALVAHDRDEMLQALDDICARVVPVAVANFGAVCSPLDDGLEFAEATKAVIPPVAWDLVPGGRPVGCDADECCTGSGGTGVAANGAGMCPLVYRVAANGSGLGQSVVDGVQMMAAYSPFDVTSSVTGQPADLAGVALPVGFTSASFIKAVAPFSFGPLPLPGIPGPGMTATTFLSVIPDTDVTFSVDAFNDFLPQGPLPRLFVATIDVSADSCYALDTREVFILVPPADLPEPV
jgi:hypothetical protein